MAEYDPKIKPPRFDQLKTVVYLTMDGIKKDHCEEVVTQH